MRIISGIQPSGKLHIGNYLGAIKNWLKLQSASRRTKNQCFFFIADYHSITEDYNPKEKSKEIFDLAVDLLALGLNPKKSTIFIQSQIPAHANLAWILNTMVKIPELERMTQFKDKTQSQKENLNAGLFDYPVLMAADILIYKAEAVPVGEDQVQHLELTRDIARRFNAKFGKTFAQPKPIFTATPRIMSLSDPTKKMSKSGGEKSYIAITDSPKVIREKIKSAVSDTGGKDKKTGGNNLLTIFNALAQIKTEKTEYLKFKKDYTDGKLKYSEFKPRLADLIANYFADYRGKRAKLSQNPEYIKNVLRDGAEKASVTAEKTLKEVKEKIGLSIN